MATMGTTLQDKRLALGLSQAEVANQLHVSRQTISYWENDRRQPDIVSLIKLSKIYHLSLDDLVKNDPKVIKKIEAEQRELAYSRSTTLKILSLVSLVVAVLLIATVISFVGLHWLSVIEFRIVATGLIFVLTFLASAPVFLVTPPQNPEPVFIKRPKLGKTHLGYGTNVNPRNYWGLGIYLLAFLLVTTVIWILPH
ncbi:helix-turn-helix domain-containing protein [Lactobacillaceae bacterium L1_55_11]|nr:helix-turn-helix domain-containing protein [Lactobacillaceae bacterium L1_55_11]